VQKAKKHAQGFQASRTALYWKVYLDTLWQAFKGTSHITFLECFPYAFLVHIKIQILFI
jgi:hypothetical protein